MKLALFAGNEAKLKEPLVLLHQSHIIRHMVIHAPVHFHYKLSNQNLGLVWDYYKWRIRAVS